MSNDDAKKQAEQAAKLKAHRASLNNLNIPEQSQGHVPPVANTPSISEQARRKEAASENIEREKSAFTIEKVYGYVVADPRPLTEEEKIYINLSSLMPSNPARNYEMVKFYANGTPTDAIPSLGFFPAGSYEEQMVLSSLPEALHDKTDNGSLIQGQIICIEYKESNHGFPVVVSSPNIVGATTGGETTAATTLKDKFYNNPFSTNTLRSLYDQVTKSFNNVIDELEQPLPAMGKLISTNGFLRVTRQVNEEYKKWKYGKLKETDPRAYGFLKTYWDKRGVTSWTPSGTPWSAAFISYVLRGSGFPGGSSHRSYTTKIIEKKKNTPWNAFSIPKNHGYIQIALGDVVVKSRGKGTKEEYNNTHGDVVYKIEPFAEGFVAYTAGGNLGNSAKDGDRLILDHNKILTNAGKYKIILKYGDVKNNVNN